jgi:hypothetical protein
LHCKKKSEAFFLSFEGYLENFVVILSRGIVTGKYWPRRTQESYEYMSQVVGLGAKILTHHFGP